MNIDELSLLSRRAFLGTSLAAAGVASAATFPNRLHAAAAAEPLLDPITMHRKLRFRTDEGLVFWWLQGVKYGQVGATLTPLYTNLIGTIQRIVPTDDGGFDMTMLEMTILLDTNGDQALSEWKNPYTGEILPVSLRPVGPITVHYNADDSRQMPKTMGGARLESEAEISPAVIVNDDVFMSEVIRARVFRPEREHPYEVNDMSHYHGSLQELADPAVTMADTTVSFAEVTGWQNWMNMGSRDGALTSRTFGRKVASFDMMPQKWRDLLAEKAPDIAADPVAALDGPAAEFDR
jgi:hypothetical protein